MGTDDEIEALVRSFEDGSLPRAGWTHRAHLTVALWYLHSHPRGEATRLIRDGIRRYNERHGNTKGYHETVTLAWVAVVHGFLREQGDGVPLPVLSARLLECCGDPGFSLLRFYTRNVLMSDEARRVWVPPDKEPIESANEGEEQIGAKHSAPSRA
jgi:hypothetical protein